MYPFIHILLVLTELPEKNFTVLGQVNVDLHSNRHLKWNKKNYEYFALRLYLFVII